MRSARACDHVRMARPKNQTARRAELIEAATKALLEHGATNARLRDIAEAAGVTPASVLYYYPDIQELFTAVFERGGATYCRLREEQIAAARGAQEQLAACIHSGVPWPGHAEQTSRLLYELFPVALRNEAAAEQQRSFIARQAALYQHVLERGLQTGEFHLAAPAADLARSFVALEDGYCLDVLVGAATAAEVEQRLLTHARITTQAR